MWELSALGIASLVGMVIAVLGRFIPSAVAKIVDMVAGIAAPIVLIVFAFSVLFQQIQLSLLTSNVMIGFVVFLGIGYAAAKTLLGFFK